MYSYQDILFAGDLSFHQRQMMLSIQLGAVEIQIEVAVLARQLHDLHPLHQLLACSPVFDQCFNRANLQPVFLREINQLRQPRHRAVVAHDFANHADGPAACQLHQVHRCFRVPGALQHAAGFGAQWKHVPRLHQVVQYRRRIGHHLNGARTVGRADAGGDAARGVNADLKIGLERLAIVTDHPLDAQLLQPFGGGWHANQAAAVLGHEIDGLRRRVLGGHDQIAFVLAVSVIHHDDHPAFPQLLDHRFDGIKRLLHLSRLNLTGSPATGSNKKALGSVRGLAGWDGSRYSNSLISASAWSFGMPSSRKASGPLPSCSTGSSSSRLGRSARFQNRPIGISSPHW